MKLTDIDLNDPAEISRAIDLLNFAATNTKAEIRTEDNPATGERPASDVFITQSPKVMDAATVFGGGAAVSTPLPIPAPSTAGVATSPIALAGLPATLPATLPAMPAPAHYIAPEVHAQVIASVTPTLPAQTGVDLDTNGLPWDARIHAATKTKTKAGVWTAKRGLNDGAMVSRVEAELRAQAAAGGAPAATPLPAAPLAAALVPSPPAQVIAQGFTASPSDVPMTFEQIMPRVTAATIGGALPPNAVQAACAAVGLPSVVALQTNPAYVPHVWAHLKASYPALV